MTQRPGDRQTQIRDVLNFYRLVDASQGAIRSGQGANYGLSHPLDSKVVPTDDPRQNEEGLKEVKKTRT